MADTDIDDSFEDDNFDDDEDARLADDDVTARGRGNSLEKRLLIDNFFGGKTFGAFIKRQF